ncbi:hypothetical protein DL98DRAFT_580750 [Cadophora sp. DSE1049]|nr:hypothetical protein DL98DRAFT_580750 [Cadophora sp. DSE1049]
MSLISHRFPLTFLEITHYLESTVLRFTDISALSLPISKCASLSVLALLIHAATAQDDDTPSIIIFPVNPTIIPIPIENNMPPMTMPILEPPLITPTPFIDTVVGPLPPSVPVDPENPSKVPEATTSPTVPQPTINQKRRQRQVQRKKSWRARRLYHYRKVPRLCTALLSSLRNPLFSLKLQGLRLQRRARLHLTILFRPS